MAGNKEGGAKSHATLKRKLGEAGYRLHMARVGKKGGEAKVPKGFHMTRKKAAYAEQVHERNPMKEQPSGVEEDSTD